jgi:hypothetical protein
MNKVKVCYFTQYDIEEDLSVQSKHMAKLDDLKSKKQIKGTPLLKTTIEVDESKLDGNGFYWPDK